MKAVVLATLAALALVRDDDAALRAFQGGDFPAAAREYAALLGESPASARLRYNLGTSLLMLRRYEAAREHLQAASRAPGAPGARPHAYYNLGNADLFPAFAGSAEAERRARLLRAIVAYKRALLLNPDDADAKWNLELARRLLDQTPQAPEPRPQPSGGGGGGNDRQNRGALDPRPQTGGAGGTSPEMTRGQAERLLSSAEQREAGVQQDKLRKPQPRSPTAHD